jgi:hypothetical protein
MYRNSPRESGLLYPAMRQRYDRAGRSRNFMDAKWFSLFSASGVT